VYRPNGKRMGEEGVLNDVVPVLIIPDIRIFSLLHYLFILHIDIKEYLLYDAAEIIVMMGMLTALRWAAARRRLSCLKSVFL